MKTTIDIKSALIGLTLGIVVTVCVAAASKSHGPVGRYQVTASHAHGLVVDTATGKVWTYFLGTSSGGVNQSFYEPKLDQD